MSLYSIDNKFMILAELDFVLIEYSLKLLNIHRMIFINILDRWLLNFGKFNGFTNYCVNFNTVFREEAKSWPKYHANKFNFVHKKTKFFILFEIFIHFIFAKNIDRMNIVSKSKCEFNESFTILNKDLILSVRGNSGFFKATRNNTQIYIIWH